MPQRAVTDPLHRPFPGRTPVSALGCPLAQVQCQRPRAPGPGVPARMPGGVPPPLPHPRPVAGAAHRVHRAAIRPGQAGPAPRDPGTATGGGPVPPDGRTGRPAAARPARHGATDRRAAGHCATGRHAAGPVTHGVAEPVAVLPCRPVSSQVAPPSRSPLGSVSPSAAARPLPRAVEHRLLFRESVCPRRTGSPPPATAAPFSFVRLWLSTELVSPQGEPESDTHRLPDGTPSPS